MKKLFAIFLAVVLICGNLPVVAFADETITFEPGEYLVGQDLQAGVYLVTADIESIIATILREIPPGSKENPTAGIAKLDMTSFTTDESTAEIAFEEGTKFTIKNATMRFSLIDAFSASQMEDGSTGEKVSENQGSRPDPLNPSTLFEGVDGYSYDKFDRKWKWSDAYVKEYTDAVVGIGIQTISAEGGDYIQETDLFIRFLDAQTSEVFSPVQSIDFLIDDDVYSYKKMSVGSSSSMVALGENGMLLIEALAYCDPNNVEVRIGTKDKSYEIDINPTDFTWSLKDYCRTYLKLNLVDYFDDPAEMAGWEELFPLTVNGKKAVYSEMRKDRDMSKIDETFTEPKPTPKPTASPTSSPSTTPTPRANNDNAGNATTAQKNAVRSAKAYLDFMGFSRDGLINQLVSFDKFSEELAVYGADHCGADWNEQAVRSAKAYLDFMGFSREGLINQLETFDKYSHEQAVYGADNVGADWNEQAVKSGQAYLDFMGFSRDGLINQLVSFDKYTYEQATYAANKLGL